MFALLPFLVAVAAFLAAFASVSPALASPTGGAHSEPWSDFAAGAPLPEADLEPPSEAEPPAVRRPDTARRPVELDVGSALGLARVPLLAPTRPEPAFFVGAAWRAAPWFALGAEATLEPARGAVGRGWLALTARTYFIESGSVDPYAVWSIGAGSLERGDGERIERGTGWLLRAGFGVDFALSNSLKLGPALYYTRAIWGARELCSSHACTAWQSERVALPSGFVSLAVRLAWQLGDPY
ncbi:MAG TPA: hypothetical protein VF989_15915 [Polyangiaceae bacterium]